MKKYLALLLVLVMALGMFAACNGSDANNTTAPKGNDTPAGTTAPVDTTPEPKDPITLVWHIRGVGTQTDHEKVEAEFNKLLQSYAGFEHITVDLRHNLSSEHAPTVERAYTAKEQIDIVCTVNLQPIDLARDGYFLGLSEYFDEHQTLWNQFPEWLWETQYVDDDYYVVPNYQRGHNPKFWYMRAEDAALVDWDGFVDLVTWENGYAKGTVDQICAKIEEMYLALKAAGKTYYMPNIASLMMLGYSQNMYWHEYLNALTPAGPAVFANHYTGDVDSLWLTEDWKTLWSWSCKWNDAGYFPVDATTAETGTYSFDNGSYWIQCTQSINWNVEDAEPYLESVTKGNPDLVVIRHVDDVYMENRWAANGNAVSATCENPEDAVAFLELLNSEAGIPLYNMLVYGLEGEHWEWVDKEANTIKTLQYDSSQASGEAPYGMLKWCVGNTLNVYLNQACNAKENEDAAWINANGVASPYAGLKIDLTEVETQIANCKAVDTEWTARMCWGQDGAAGFETAYAAFIEAMKTAGVEDVITICQEQIDDYIANKG